MQIPYIQAITRIIIMIIIIIRIRAAFVKAVNVKVTVLVDVIPCHLVSAYVCFGGTCTVSMLMVEDKACSLS